MPLHRHALRPKMGKGEKNFMVRPLLDGNQKPPCQHFQREKRLIIKSLKFK